MSTHDEELQKRLQANIAEKRAKENRYTVGIPDKQEQEFRRRTTMEHFALVAFIIIGIAVMQTAYSHRFNDESVIALAVYLGALVAVVIYATRNRWTPKAAHLSKAGATICARNRHARRYCTGLAGS